MRKIPQIMGILNCTPDSFSDGSPTALAPDFVKIGLRLIEEGAKILDVGGESTRPGAKPVSVSEEINRVIPVISELRTSTTVPISIDTSKPEVALRAAQAGASILNDVSAAANPELLHVAAKWNMTYVAMHSRGTPQTMGELTDYPKGIQTLLEEVENQILKAKTAGIEKIWVDPGFGFAKTTAQNFMLLESLSSFKKFGYPILVGLSRKRFLGEVTRQENPKDRDMATLAANTLALERGADILRVHNVAATKDLVSVWSAL